MIIHLIKYRNVIQPDNADIGAPITTSNIKHVPIVTTVKSTAKLLTSGPIE